jgi:uncharacterized protein (DUF302 family)
MEVIKTHYGFKKEVSIGYEASVIKITDELKKEGFGFLTEIDVKKTLKVKINEEFTKYIILGACNPNLAIQALREEMDIGLLLPCNIIVYENTTKGSVIIATIDPSSIVELTGREDLNSYAKQVGQKLTSAMERI